ncbi:MAG: hypothetical protein ACQEQC_02575 [Elusimicrobiota bacterium]
MKQYFVFVRKIINNKFIAITGLIFLLSSKFLLASSGLVLKSTVVYTGGEKIISAASTLDSRNDLIVVGTSGSSDTDIRILKYGSDLVLKSSNTFDSGGDDEATSVAVDSNDNIVVGGSADSKFLAVKFSTGLNVISYSTTSASSKLSGIAINNNTDNIYAGSDWRWIVDYGTSVADGIKNISSDDGESESILLNSSGYIYAGGSVGGDEDAIVKKYDSSLTSISSVTYDSGGLYDSVIDICRDSEDNIFAAGHQDQTGSSNSYFIKKYDSNLSAISDTIRYSDNSNKYIVNSYEDDIGLIVVSDLNESGTSEDIHIRNYNSNLRLKDSYDLDTGSSDELPADVTVDSEGGIYVVGTVDSTNTVVAKFNYEYSPLIIDSITEGKVGENNELTISASNIPVSAKEDIAVTFTGEDTENFQVTVSSINSSTIDLQVDIPGDAKLGNKVAVVEDLLHYDTDSTDFSVVQEEYVDITEDTTITANTEQGALELGFLKNSLIENSHITISLIDKSDAPEAPDDIKLSDMIFKVQADPLGRPEKYPVLKMNYTENNFDDLDKDKLSVVYYDDAGNGWVRPADTYKDADSGNIITYITNFGIFAAAESKEESTEDIVVYPNPYKPASGGKYDNTDFGEGIVFSGVPDGASLKIFNVVGEIVHDASPADSTYIWNTELDNGKLAPSGLYVYLLTGGSEDIRGEVSIVR